MTTVAVGPPPVWKLAVVSFLPAPLKDRALARWVQHLPISVLLLAQAWLTLRLNDTPFEDEALYIGAGHDYWNHWLHGTAVPVYGTYFSGAPLAYPVLAGALDSVGGLQLVRAFSLLCMLFVTLCLRSVTRYWWGERAALLSVAVFVFTGQVMFLGAFATFDASCLLSIAVALWALVCRRGVSSAVLAGLALASAVVLKYTGAVFVPIVLGAALFTPYNVSAYRSYKRQLARVLLAGSLSLTVLAVGYWQFGSGIKAGIKFTTSNRKALDHVSAGRLLHFVQLDLGVQIVLATVGIFVLMIQVSARRNVLLVLCLLAGAAVLPTSQMRIGEFVSFEKHMAYSALFLAPLAGQGLMLFTRKRTTSVLVLVVVTLVGITGLVRSDLQYQWAPVGHVVHVVEEDPVPGRYLSNSALPLSYYTRQKYPKIVWQDHYELFASPVSAWQAALKDRTYEGYVIRTGSTGNPVEDNRVSYFVSLLQKSPNYKLVVTPFAVRKYSPYTWLIYRAVPK